MSAFGMKPTFSDQEGYRRFRDQWRALFKSVSKDIRRKKYHVKKAQRLRIETKQKQLVYSRALGFKLMGLLQEGKDRWKKILTMRKAIDEQMASFPLTLKDCRTVDFHYNKGSVDYKFLPMWTIKTKGRTFYVHHMSADCSWTTREIPEGSTRGMIRFRNCNLYIDEKGDASITTS